MAIDRDKVLEAAQALVDKKRFDKAIVEYQKVLAADPKDARTLLKIGEVYAKAEQFERAITTFEQVAQLHAAQGFALKAVAAYLQAREIVQRHVPHLTDRFGHLVFRIADLYVQLHRNNDAIQIYEEAAARLEAAGRARDAVDFLKKIVDLDPKGEGRAYRLAEGLLRLGDAEAAVPHLGTAAEGLVARGQHDDALGLLERALAVRADPKLARQAAQLYLDRGGPKDAASAFLKIQIAYKHSPKDLDTLGLLARALYVLRQPERAIEVHKEAARIANEIGNRDALDLHMDTLLTRAPNDPVVRKLAASWPSAPAWVHDPAPLPDRDPGPRLPQPPPRAPLAPPVPPFAPPSPALAPQQQPAPPPAPVPLPHAPPLPPPPHAAAPAPPQPPIATRMTPPPPPRMPPPLPPRGAPPPPPSPPQTAAPRMTPIPLIPRMTPAARSQPVHDGGYAPKPPAQPVHDGGYAPKPPAQPVEAPRAVAAPLAPPIPQVAPPPPPSPPPYVAPPIPALEMPDLPDIDTPSGSWDGPKSYSGRGGFDEEALEEVEFFVSQGMYEDAIGLLDEQLERLPEHPLLLDRKREVQEMADAVAAAQQGDP